MLAKGLQEMSQGSLTPDMILLLSLEPIWVSWGDGQWSVNANPNGLLMPPKVPHLGHSLRAG